MRAPDPSRPPTHSTSAWLAAALVLAASCDGCPPKPKPAQMAQELVARTLAAVIVTPGSASVTAGTAQQFSAAGLMSDGTSVPISVTWSATGGTVGAAGLYTAGGSSGTFRVIAAEQGGTLADTSFVMVTSGDAPSPGGLTVEVAGAPSTVPKWLLLDTDLAAPGAAACPSDLVKAVVGSEVDLGLTTSNCATQISVFASGFAPVLDPLPTPVPAAGKNVVTEALPSRWSVKLHVVAEYPEAPAEAEMDRALASELFDANRMGVDFGFDGGVTLIDPSPNTVTGTIDPRALAIRGLCPGAAGNPGLRLPGRLNVIYVREDQWGYGSTVYGYDCLNEGFPDIIFIRQEHAPATLTHEIGHALSLAHAGVGFLLGLYGWTDANVMQSSAFDPQAPRPTDHFSLGQAYRANFNGSSWLNASGVRSGATKSCQSTAPTDKVATSPHWPCPLLQVDGP